MEHRAKFVQKPVILITILMVLVWVLILLYTASDRSISDTTDYTEAQFRYVNRPKIKHQRWDIPTEIAITSFEENGAERVALKDAVEPMNLTIAQIRQRIKTFMNKLDELDNAEIKEVKEMIRKKGSLLKEEDQVSSAKEENGDFMHELEEVAASGENISDGDNLLNLEKSLHIVEKEKFRLDREKQAKKLAEHYSARESSTKGFRNKDMLQNENQKHADIDNEGEQTVTEYSGSGGDETVVMDRPSELMELSSKQRPTQVEGKITRSDSEKQSADHDGYSSLHQNIRRHKVDEKDISSDVELNQGKHALQAQRSEKKTAEHDGYSSLHHYLRRHKVNQKESSSDVELDQDKHALQAHHGKYKGSNKNEDDDENIHISVKHKKRVNRPKKIKKKKMRVHQRKLTKKRKGGYYEKIKNSIEGRHK